MALAKVRGKRPVLHYDARPNFKSRQQNQHLKIKKAYKRSKSSELLKGLTNSKIIRAVILTGVVAIGLSTIPFSFPAWVIASGIIGALALGILSQLPKGGLEKIIFELGSIKRALRSKNYNEIPIPFRLDKSGVKVRAYIDDAIRKTLTDATDVNSKMFLGALPNGLTNDEIKLFKKEKIKSVISLNAPWEREPRGLTNPFRKEDYKQLGIDYFEINVKDHTLLTNEQLEEGANRIFGALLNGKNIYIHCKAGNGRSAQIIAAFLIKYCNFSVDEACDWIKKNRPSSTIFNKTEALDGFIVI